MNSLKLWTAIGMLVLASSAGDVMLSAAMKRIGDLDEIRCSSLQWRVHSSALGESP